MERTVCDCADCRRPCRHVPGALAPGDFERIAERLGLRPDDPGVFEYFEASEGALVGRVERGRLVTARVPSITPRLTERGCVFLGADGLCQIHEVSPFGCSMFDHHQSYEEASQRSRELITRQAHAWRAEGPYAHQWATLSALGHTASSLEERRAAERADLESGETSTGGSAMLDDRPQEQPHG